MGHIKEPIGVDFIVDPTPLTSEDKKKISAIIAHYKATGKKPPKYDGHKQHSLPKKKSKLTGKSIHNEK